MKQKHFIVIIHRVDQHGLRSDDRCEVVLNGVGEDEPLTPALARRAVAAACGTSNASATVTSTDAHGYRVYSAKSVRRFVL